MIKQKEKTNENRTAKNLRQKKISDGAYRQVNSSSFKYNFKLLMGHYKVQEQARLVN
jgi:hypothetical protein